MSNKPRNEVAPAETPGLGGLMTLAVGVVIVAALYFGREVFIPIVLAMLLSFVLAPIVDVQRRYGMPRVPAVVLAVLTALGIVIALATVIGLQVAQLVSDAPRYEATVQAKIQAVREGPLGRLATRIQRAGREIEKATTDPNARPAEPDPGAAPPPPPPLPVEVRAPEATPLQLAERFLAPVAHPLATVGIVFIVVIFILVQREDLRDRLIRLFGSSDLHRTTLAMDDAARRLSRYFLTQLALNAGFGVFVGIGLWLIGVPSPVLWGVFAALMRFIPYIGSILAGALPALLAAAVDPGWTMMFATIALFAISEPLMGHVVEPLVYGQSTGLSPFAVLVAAIFWTWLWGPIGLLLATPLTVVLVVLGRHVDRLEFLDVLFGDRPALSPAENFYQRMLAGDPDEAAEYAEQLLKERSLSSYYDEVALKGLQLAANDAGRGVLTPPQLERLKTTILGLIDDLAAYHDRDPVPAETMAPAENPAGKTSQERTLPKVPAVAENAPPAWELPTTWRGEGAILCIAGRGPLDEAAATMLAQLLGKHGLGARVVPHEAVSRSNVIGLDVTGVAMVCISYLEISGSPAHLRYLLRRLRQRLPKAPILVGLWPSDDAVLTDANLRTTLGADHYVVSLRDAVEACLKAATAAAEAAKAEPSPDGEGPQESARQAVREDEASKVESDVTPARPPVAAE
jgi:predicted PurR-regulated permease PerM